MPIINWVIDTATEVTSKGGELLQTIGQHVPETMGGTSLIEKGRQLEGLSAKLAQLKPLTVGDKISLSGITGLVTAVGGQQLGEHSRDAAATGLTILSNHPFVKKYLATPVPPSFQKLAQHLSELTPQSLVSGEARKWLPHMFLVIFLGESSYKWNAANESSKNAMKHAYGPFQIQRMIAVTMRARGPMRAWMEGLIGPMGEAANPYITELPGEIKADLSEEDHTKYIVAYMVDMWASVKKMGDPAIFASITDPGFKNIAKFIWAHRGGTSAEPNKNDLAAAPDAVARTAAVLAGALSNYAKA